MDPQQQAQQPQQAFQPAPQQPSPPPPVVLPENSFFSKIKGHKTGVIVTSVCVLLLSGMVTYVFVSPAQKSLVSPANIDHTITPPPTTVISATSPTIVPTTKPSLTPTPTIPSIDWKTYTNNTYGYSIKYPPDWIEKDLGALEPKVPSYIVFNPPSATASARNITISISTRSYSEQLALGASNSATTVGGISGTQQSFKDSDGNTSTVITLPRSSNLLVLRAKTASLPIFNQIITTLTTTK